MQNSQRSRFDAPAFSVEGSGGTEVFGRTDSDTLLRAFSSYLVDELGRSPRTAVSYCAAIKRAEKVLDKPAAKITADDLRSILRETDYAPASKRGIVVAFHQFHDWGATDGRWKRNGISTLKTPKVIREPRAPITPLDARRLLAEATHPIQARAVYLPLFAGLRIREATLLREEHWHDDLLVIPPEIAKGGKKRTVPVHPELQAIKDLILSREPKSMKSPIVLMGRLRDRLGITDMEGKPATAHTLRRTCASEMYDAHGVPWEVVAKILGHGGDVTALYARISVERMREAVLTLDYRRGVPVQLSLW